MTTKEERDKEEREKREKDMARKRRIAQKKFVEEKEEIKKRSFTSFGKLILSDEYSSPVVSFPVAKKFNKAGAPTSLNTPGPIYDADDKYKYKNVRVLDYFSLSLGVLGKAKDRLSMIEKDLSITTTHIVIMKNMIYQNSKKNGKKHKVGL